MRMALPLVALNFYVSQCWFASGQARRMQRQWIFAGGGDGVPVAAARDLAMAIVRACSSLPFHLPSTGMADST
jgi:hypothetical protein